MNNINDLVEMLIYLEDMEILSVYIVKRYGGASKGTPGRTRLRKYSKNHGAFCQTKRHEMSSFRLNNGLNSGCRLPKKKHSCQKCHFIVCNVTKYSTNLGVF